MFSFKKLVTASALMLMAIVPLSVHAAESDYVKADWKFTQSQVASGSIESGQMVITDASGNGNDLEMRTYGSYSDTAYFTDESLEGDAGSIFLNGDASTGGIDFVTIDGAPINSETFPNGYTIEIIYKMPDDWTTADRWTSLLSRLGSSNGTIDDEGEDVTSVIHVSNCKEIQFIPANQNNKSSLSSDVWSIAMDKAENWYSIVITYDNNTFKTYINGADSFRNIDASDMQGLYADPNDGRFRIGSRVKSGTPYRFTRGYIQEIRLSDKALDREDWLVPNPEDYVGEYGDDRPFDMPEGDSYNFVFLPDMQNATKFKNDVLEIAANWIVENKDEANIAAVVSLGDNVQDYYDTAQWENIVADMSIMAEGGVKTLVQPGNHDTNDGANYWYFDKYFGPDSDFQALISDYAECSSPSGTGYVMDVPAGSFDYKVITIDMYKLADGTDVSWLKSQLLKYSQNPVILVSHDIQNCSDTAPNDTKLSDKGTILWNIVKDYDNVFMMVGGHSHGYGVLELENSYGHKVFSVLADYQFSYNGGNALFKFAEFDEANNQIHLTTFSPYVATLSDDEKTFFDVNYMTGTGHDDIVEFNFAERLGSLSVYVQGENLIDNYSFEETTDGWTNNNNGTIQALSSSGWVRSTDYAHDGSYSLKQVGSGAGASDINFCTFIPIEAGKTYNLSLWEYSTVSNTSGYGRMSAFAVVSDIGALGSGIEIMDCGGFSSWYNNSHGVSPRDNSYSVGWTERSYIFDTTDTPDAKYIMIAYAWGEANTFYIDDISLTELSFETVQKALVTALTATANGETVDVDVTYSIDAYPDAKLIAAGYDESGELVDFTYVSDGSASLTGSTISEVRVFCWEGLDNMIPLTKTKVADVTQGSEE
ncbi:MAG: carbohydrate binding domain-containing protein [Clostridia bacterium]|nr:carbohydrate binding domain-containing protein [Clostridia bacterium]